MVEFIDAIGLSVLSLKITTFITTTDVPKSHTGASLPMITDELSKA